MKEGILMSTTAVNPKAERNAFMTVLAIFSMGQIAGSIDAAIALIGKAFNLTSSTTMYVSSVAALASVVIGLVIGFIAGKKVTYKAIVYCAGVCVLAGGLLPFFANNFAVLLVLRAVYGIGYGAMMSLQNTFAALTLSKEKQTTALGIGMFVGYGTNCVLQFVGGLLADIQWNYVFLNNLFLIIPFVISLRCCPDIPNIPAPKANEKKERASFPPVIWIMCILMALVGLLISPLLCVTIFLGGMGFSTTQAGAMMVTGASVSKPSVALASSLIMACFIWACSCAATSRRGSAA